MCQAPSMLGLAVCQTLTCWIWCQPNLDTFILGSIPSPRHASCQALDMPIGMCILSWNAWGNDHVPLAHSRKWGNVDLTNMSNPRHLIWCDQLISSNSLFASYQIPKPNFQGNILHQVPHSYAHVWVLISLPGNKFLRPLLSINLIIEKLIPSILNHNFKRNISLHLQKLI